MHFLVFDSRPSALFFSTSILSDRTSRPGVYQLIAHPAPGCHCEPMRFFFFFTPTFSKWVTPVFHRVPLIEENNYSQPKLSPVFPRPPWSLLYVGTHGDRCQKQHVNQPIYHCPSRSQKGYCVAEWPCEGRDHALNLSLFTHSSRFHQGCQEEKAWTIRKIGLNI